MPVPTRCIFCSTTKRIIEFVPNAADDTAAAERIARFSPKYGGDLVVMPFDDAWQLYENSFKCEPAEITADRFHEMLGVLPPVAWKGDPTGESFKISERTAGSITAIYVRIRDRYFEFSDSILLPHRDCVARVRAKFFPEG